MARIRRVPTSITSARHLVRALEASGFKRVERFETPQPLMSWRKQPLADSAEIIVRRDQIGATADDLGFTRRADGAFDALVSEIHLSRIDRRWFQQLHERCAALAAADGEDASAPVLRDTTSTAPAEPTVVEAPQGTSRAPGAPLADALHSTRASLHAALQGLVQAVDSEPTVQHSVGELNLDRELAAVLGAARQASGKLGCLPIVLGGLVFMLFAIAMRNTPLFVMGMVATAALCARKGKQRLERMVSAAASEFRARFRDDPQLRARAVRKLHADLSKQTPELKQVVEGLLRRVGA